MSTDLLRDIIFRTLVNRRSLRSNKTWIPMYHLFELLKRDYKTMNWQHRFQVKSFVKSMYHYIMPKNLFLELKTLNFGYINIFSSPLKWLTWNLESINSSNAKNKFVGVDKILSFFWPSAYPLRWHFLPYKSWQKLNFFWLNTHLIS